MLRSAHGIMVDCAERSDPGRDPEKQTNEDAYGVAETPFGVAAVVCDGMGGHDAGELASHTAVQRILETLKDPHTALERLLSIALERAHAEVYALGGDAPLDVRPGSTAVVVALAGKEAIVAHVGDSRVYRVRGRTAERLTRDHSVVEALMAAGAISPEAAKVHPEASRITRALGIAAEVEPEVLAPQRLELGDSFILCSDGLSDLVEDAELGEIIGTASSPDAAAQKLVDLANERGGHDNITVVVLRVLGTSTEERRDKTMGMTEAGRTVVDGPAFTVVMPTSDSPSTLNYDSERGRRAAPTLVDPLIAATRAASKGGPVTQPTMPTGLPHVAVAPNAATSPATPVSMPRVDGSGRVDGMGRVDGVGRADGMGRADDLASKPPRPKSEARLLFWSAAALCFAILAAIALWSLVR